MGILLLRTGITSGDVEDLYPWYPALNLGAIPFHVGAGAWGAQLAVQAPTAPTITRTANAANLAQLEAEMGTPGTRVTITADITGGGQVDPTAVTDVEIVIPNGRLVNVVWGGTGNFGTNLTAWNRVRWTKAEGDSIGGHLHNFWMNGEVLNDLVIDGLQISDANSDAVPSILIPSTVVRLAIVNNQIHSPEAGFGYGGRYIVVAGNSLMHNAVNGSGTLSAWGFRNGAGGTGDSAGPYVYYQNDIRGINYFQLRFHPAVGGSGDPYYVYAWDNVLLDRSGNAMIGAGDTETSVASDPISGMWFVENTLYVNGGISQTGHRADGTSCVTDYWRITGNIVNGTTSPFSTWDCPDGAMSGNTYNAAPGSDPAWGAAGDPTTIDWTP